MELLYNGFGRATDPSPVRFVLVASSLMLVAIAGLVIAGGSAMWLSLASFFVAVAGTVVVDAAAGSLFGGVDRNLFPFEVAIVIFAGAPGAITGIAIGRIARCLRQTQVRMPK